MSFVALGVAVVGGAAKLIQGAQQRKARKEEQIQANAELAKRQQAYESLEVTNPYANLENTYEDLTVNQQQAEFMMQQNAIQQANTMQGLRAAAGGSGVAGLAQAMAGQGQIAAQKASTTIGQQEAANLKAAAQGESARQRMVAQGEVQRQTREKGKQEDLLEMSMGRKAAADEARSLAATQQWQGASEIVGGVGTWAKGNIDAGGTWWNPNR